MSKPLFCDKILLYQLTTFCMSQAITRVVKLQVNPESIETFLAIYRHHQQQISQFNGCISVQAYQDHQLPQVFFTISQWASTEALDHYRYSEFFKTLWGQVKPLFSHKAEAHSLTVL